MNAARGPGVRWLLVGVGGVALLSPVLAVLAMRLYGGWLMRQTETELIAQSVVIGEAWRSAWLEGREASHKEVMPPGATEARYAPIEPLLGLGSQVLAANDATPVPGSPADARAERAGAAIEPMLRRAQIFNLSGVRVLDARGCAVAATRGQATLCYERYAEVAGAMGGRYTAVARARRSDEPPPPLGGISRRGDTRVFTALPVFHEGEVVGIVVASRTHLSAVETLWDHRRAVFVAAALSLLSTVLLSLFCAQAIALPVRSLTRSAQAAARGARWVEPALMRRRWVPRELLALSASLAAMTAELTRRAHYIGEFAANVSHELKTPLTSIRGAAELLVDGWRDMHDAQRQRFLQNIDADVGRMSQLVSGLLELARLDNAPPREGQETEVVTFLAALEARYGDAVRIERRGAPRTAAIGEEHLMTAVGNLVDNALAHRREKAWVVARAEGSRLCVEVHDDGPGIREQNRERIFERFFTTRRDDGGTGLGLAIVKAIADSHEGHVAFRTGPDGTVFTLLV